MTSLERALSTLKGRLTRLSLGQSETAAPPKTDFETYAPKTAENCLEIVSTVQGVSLGKEASRGGGGGIRTRDTVSRIHTFQACAFSRSATPPVAFMVWTRSEAHSTRRGAGASRAGPGLSMDSGAGAA